MSNDMLDKIRGLLAKAESTEFPAEAETYNAKASELIAKYGVDQALLNAKDPNANTVGDKVIFVPGPYAVPKTNLLYALAKAMGASAVRKTSPIPGAYESHLFGMASDVERIEILYTSLLIQLHRFMVVDFERASERARRQPRTWRRDYMDGFVSAVVKRVRAAEQYAQNKAQTERGAAGESGPSVELVLRDRSVQVAARVSEVYPNIRIAAARRPTILGYYSGLAGGNRADIGGARLGGGGSRALS